MPLHIFLSSVLLNFKYSLPHMCRFKLSFEWNKQKLSSAWPSLIPFTTAFVIFPVLCIHNKFLSLLLNSKFGYSCSRSTKTFSWSCNSYPCPLILDWAGEGDLCCTLHNDTSYIGYRPPTLIQFCFWEDQRLPLLIHHLLLLSMQDKEGNWSETWRLISNEFQDTSHNPSSSTCAKCSGIASF